MPLNLITNYRLIDTRATLARAFWAQLTKALKVNICENNQVNTFAINERLCNISKYLDDYLFHLVLQHYSFVLTAPQKMVGCHCYYLFMATPLRGRSTTYKRGSKRQTNRQA